MKQLVTVAKESFRKSLASDASQLMALTKAIIEINSGNWHFIRDCNDIGLLVSIMVDFVRHLDWDDFFSSKEEITGLIEGMKLCLEDSLSIEDLIKIPIKRERDKRIE